MTSEMSYSFVSHCPSSSNVDEMRAPAATKKSRRASKPKRSTDQNSVEKKERRRQQILLAQRAYRARSEANTKALQDRVARLEAALERTSQAIISFTDVLIGTQAPVSHQQIAHHLRDTVKTCLNSAMYGVDGQDGIADSCTSEVLPSAPASIYQANMTENERESERLPLNDHASFSPPRHISLPVLPFMPDDTMIEVPEFVHHLRITCIYHGFLLLNNPSVPLEALKRPFRLLLPLVTRDTIASYFHTSLHARMNHREPDPCSSIPYFGIGGAGTHYPNGVASSYLDWESEQDHLPKIDDALSAFSPEAQNELDGDWFDVFDLQGFLQARGIVISTTRPAKYTANRMVNAVDFATALISKGICLGHSPGFRRSDVEIAINASSWK